MIRTTPDAFIGLEDPTPEEWSRWHGEMLEDATDSGWASIDGMVARSEPRGLSAAVATRGLARGPTSSGAQCTGVH